ncbi:ABC-2 type transport system ATP-binding protein [Thermosporothrix hazakensis]|jgi:ABC-2 type transport system ATP-binding protein|uniref:ABC-2 type transport system ATP-binding protein n=2 Tax=Thermosporothrix TaxID=768650 RepID=A0A326U9M9_THEHA|nr:ABC transporter ATP-binding protein [Thermosporothrix hazakensis]PZW23909.1 ABC-2 type transport system ATP-binding protein [Thermosporothrix hazakensis]BBH90456.1 multidrug ABC transporter ATP-binding protein [Thermosporothrix sp. COM3]GCE48493.1 multidrug ABC transporter ATP-binding protein [Thermosporothrix hazakensis]
MSELMIEAFELSRTFGAKEAVKGINFSVRRGEIFGFLGHNGAGKTTTIRMLTGQIDPTGGRAQVAGYDVVRQNRELKQHIGVVFEDPNLYERLSARRNLEFACWLYDVPVSRVDEVLELVKLRDRAKEPLRTFSNGMRQRVMIARALLHRPEVLFLDEPSRGLDPITARDLRRTIARLSQEGMTILLTTHMMEEADQLCHRVAFIANGQLVANDTPRNLKLQHGERTMTVTLSEAGSLVEKLIHMDQPAEQAVLMQWMAEGKVLAVHSNEATLEDVFVKIAGTRLA